MKKLLFLALGLLLLDKTQAQTVRSVLADFGPNDGTNGAITPSPDINGNYWNNILNLTGVVDTFRLVDKANQPTGVKLKVGANFQTNGILNGGLLAPSPALLGEYAIATATQDYFFLQNAATLRFSGLDRNKRYVFHLFGSRELATEVRTTQYRFTASNVSSVRLTTSGPNVGANGYAGNNNTLAHSDTLTADANGVISLEVSRTAGTYAFLNLLRLDIVTGRSTPTVNYVFQNPGFELGNLNFWTPMAQGTGAAATVTTITRHAGSYAAQLTGGSLGLEQQISYRNTTGANAYKLSGYFYNPSTSALRGSQTAHLELLYYNSGGALLGRFNSDSLVATSTTNVWTKLEAAGSIPAGTAFVKGKAVWRNATGAAGSVYFDDLLLENYVPQNPLKLVYMGSSVPFGQGATSNYGYTAMYSALLAQRAAAGTGQPWVTANISVPGNNTVDVLNRFDADLLPQGSKYVVFALALGNEGILTGGQPIFNQFRTNLLQLIQRARANGLVPIITNGYTRNDYGPTEYTFTRQMNALIHGWNVPSVNLLGAVDDGAGRWASGYWTDALHPNDRGHAEMSRTLVPSLFDALHASKPQPTRRVSSGITLTTTAVASAQLVRLVPEEVVHPFTTAIRFKTSTTGQLVAIRDSAGLAAGTLRVGTGGIVVYQSAKGRTITGTVPVTNNRWHKLVLTHYYARGATMLYVDSVREGSVAERLRPTRLEIGGNAAPARVQYRDWLFYRSGMNQDEVLALAADSLLKSSLEIYAPLDSRRIAAPDSLANLAQSLNTLARVGSPLAIRVSSLTKQVNIYPTVTADNVYIDAPLELDRSAVIVYDVTGRVVLTTRLNQGHFSVASLPAGLYLAAFSLQGQVVYKRLIKADL
ncbi:SGNH/GDSL hydrolase family protein [Hymenobacter metallicola]|uniref:T9SS type A sorting domain-containing protein n=1 Tax=Hymenobacter metallicola TaxID=2563114 RepID=A0A4Z0PVF3_9BACT|nr:SGNH/GDSL hydrolase family protein [Hymenobacter metallicola]TGE20961.1 T9SS type A sorting domain-containing protein [Hymenobacter metallicola]